MGWSDNTGGGVELRHYRFFRFFIGYPVYAVALFSFFSEKRRSLFSVRPKIECRCFLHRIPVLAFC